MSVVKSAEQSPGRRHDVLRVLKAAHSPMSIATIADTLDGAEESIEHLGLMRGALETWEAPVTVDRLDAFVEPDLCLVQLTRQAAAT